MVQTVEDQTSDQVRYRVVVRGRLGEHLAAARARAIGRLVPRDRAWSPGQR
jgi:hypothetical protein